MTVALLTRTENASITRQSAATKSPASSAITSPGTRLGGGPLLENPVAHDPDLVRQQLLQGRERLLGAIDLDEREEAVDHDHPDDRPAERAHPLAGFAPVGQERQGGRHPEDDREEMGELPEELQPERLAPQPLDPVGAEVVQPMLGLRRRQPFGPAVQTAQGVFDRNIVNSHLDVADRTSPVIGGSIFLKRRVRPENGGNRLDEPQVRPRTSPTTQEWGRKAAQSAQIRSL